LIQGISTNLVVCQIDESAFGTLMAIKQYLKLKTPRTLVIENQRHPMFLANFPTKPNITNSNP
jgi:hypothetical protein